ncbi:MAG: carbohydrate ABC transporter substrate-binding protein [Clostridia bacterium]|nr:carbohydrate ABC transporter substrate-binding protein [Clostridia bacterium]
MKRIVSILLVCVLSVFCIGCKSESDSLFTGSEGGKNSLWVVVDLRQDSMESDLSSDVASFQDSVEDVVSEDIEEVIFECIPPKGAERDTAIDRIRTEIMSGGGPDVFIAQCDNQWEPLLFQMPEKAMALDLFLPLDEYIENAEHAEWDKFTQSVMEAGRDDEGQQLVPLSYLLPAAMYRESDVSHTPKQMTWEDMRNDEALQDAVVRLGAGFNSTGDWDFPIEYLLGELADYKAEELLFTEDELLNHVNTIIELSDYYEENAYAEKEYSTKTHLGLWFNWTGGGIITAHGPSGTYDANRTGGRLNGLTEQDPLTLVPFYSDDGGNTAVITAFAAVNRNTRRPEDAFKVIDLLMSTGRQTNSTMFAYHIYSKSNYAGMPMHEEVMSQKYEMRVDSAINFWFSLDDNNFRKVCAVRDQITVAQFSGALNAELENMMVNCSRAHVNGEDYTQIVHDAYTAMKQMMGE